MSDAPRYASKDDMLADALPGEDLAVPGLGTVRVRGLSRAEMLETGETGSASASELVVLARGLVEPALTLEEAAMFQKAKPAKVVQIISDKIIDLSGMGRAAAKAAYKSLPSEPEQRV